MFQGIGYDFDAAIKAVQQAGLMALATCTIQQPSTAQDSDGGQVYIPPVDIVGLTNIPCMQAVLSTASIQATEVKALAEIMSKNLKHVLLNGWYPAIDPDMWALINILDAGGNVIIAITYDILGVENDSQNSQTRLKLQAVNL